MISRLRRIALDARPAVWALAAAALLGCDEADVAEENVKASSATNWVVHQQPLLSIGKEGDPRYEFTHVVGMGRLPGGNWYVFDRPSAEIRIYDREGRFVSATGRRGEGPGEFLDAHFATHTSTGDIYIYDQRLRRLSKFDAEGDFVASAVVTATAPGSVFRAVGISSDDNVVWASSILPECVEGVVQTDTVVYFTQALGTARGGTLRLIPADSAIPLDSVPGVQRWGSTLNRLQVCLPSNVPYTHAPLDVVWGTNLYVALRDRLEIVITDLATGHQRHASATGQRQPVTDDYVTAYIERIESMVPRDERGAELPVSSHQIRRLREIPFPDSLPIADQFAVDALGYGWVRPYGGTEGSAGWWIFSPRGELEGQVQLPDQLYIMDIGADYVAGVETDELGVPKLRAYPLVRPAS